PPPKRGVKAGDLAEEEEVIEPLEKKLKNRFEFAWATLVSKAHPDGLWASAYHIKVAVRDGKAVWLSSGNWQSSNQPDVHPFARKSRNAPGGYQTGTTPELSRNHCERPIGFHLRNLNKTRFRACPGAGRQAGILGSAGPVRAGRRAGTGHRLCGASTVFPAETDQSHGKRSTAPDPGQLCRTCLKIYRRRQGERMVPQSIHQLAGHE